MNRNSRPTNVIHRRTLLESDENGTKIRQDWIYVFIIFWIVKIFSFRFSNAKCRRRSRRGNGKKRKLLTHDLKVGIGQNKKNTLASWNSPKLAVLKPIRRGVSESRNDNFFSRFWGKKQVFVVTHFVRYPRPAVSCQRK